MATGDRVGCFPLLSRTVMGDLFYDHVHIGMFVEELIDPELEFVDQLEAEEITKSDEVAQMGIWPAGNSIAVVGDTVVVKLADYDPSIIPSYIPR